MSSLIGREQLLKNMIEEHYFLCFLSDPRFKTFRLMSSLIGHAQLLKNMIEEHYFLCFLSVIIICILGLNRC